MRARRCAGVSLGVGPAVLFALLELGCAPPHGRQASGSLARTPSTRRAEQLAAWIEELVAQRQRESAPGDRFSGFVGVARHGRWLFQRGYALDSGAAPADADTRFRIGSINKQFTAVALMRLAEEGKLSTSDPIGRYLPSLVGPARDVPLRYLLGNSSGIADFTDPAQLSSARPSLTQSWTEPHSVDEVLATLADLPLRFRPGEVFEYSNSNYFLLGLVVQAVSGDYAAFLQRAVLARAGIRGSREDAHDAPNTAQGHTIGDDGARVLSPTYDMLLGFPGGSLRLSANDFVRWDRAFADHELLSPVAEAELLSPHRARVPAQLLQQAPTYIGYAYGINVTCDHEREIHGHLGAVAGFTSFYARVPADGYVVVVLADTERFWARSLGKPILQMLLTGQAARPGVSDERPCPTFPPSGAQQP